MSSLLRPRSVRRLPLFTFSLLPLVATGAAQAGGAPMLPTGGKVVAGQASIGAANGNALTITQSSGKAIIDWNGFSIGQGGAVRFDNGKGATLNRVTGGSVSSLNGLLSATGSLYLLNPNGVIVGKSGVVDVGGTFVASTLNVSDQNFLAGGDLTFTGGSNAAVVNLGQVGALGGDVALIAASVDNEGQVTATNGTVGLVSGYRVVMRDASLDDGLFSVVVGGPNTGVTNGGAILAANAELRAEGGNVYALAGDTAGVIRATGIKAGQGKVWLVADDGTAKVEGTVEAQGASGAPGSIETSGGVVEVAPRAKIDSHGGTWLLDPYNVTISTQADTGYGASTSSGSTTDTPTATTNINTTTLQNQLANNNVTITTGAAGQGTDAGDITLQNDVTWTSASNLTLQAAGKINVNAMMGGANAGVVLNAGGDITETGVIQASKLSATSTGGSVALGQANLVAALTGLSAAGAGSLVDGAQALTVDSGAIDTGGQASVSTGGQLTVNASPVTRASALALTSTGQGVSINGSLVLVADTSVTANNGSIGFAGSVDGAHALTVIGLQTTFGGTVGGTQPLASLTVSGPSSIAGDVSASGAITFNGALTLAPSGAANFTSSLAGGSVSVASVDGKTSGLDDLAISTGGAFTATGALGGATALGGLEFRAATASFGSSKNQVGQLAATLTSGGLSFTDVGTGPGGDGLEIAAFSPGPLFSNGLSGVSTQGQPISLTGKGLAIDAPVTVNGASTVTLASTSTDMFSPYALYITAAVNAGASGTLNLASGTQIVQLPSSQYAPTAFTAGTLNVSANGAVTLTQQNAVQTLASLDTTGDYDAAVTSGSTLTVSGTVTAHGGGLTLTGGGGLTIGSASTVTGGAVTLDGGGASVEVDGSVSAAPATTPPATSPSGTGALTIQDGSITLGASSVLNATSGVALNATSAINQANGGVISIGALEATAAGPINIASSQNAFTSVTAATIGTSGTNDIVLQTTTPLAITYQNSTQPGLTTQDGAITVTAAGLSLAPAAANAMAPSIIANGGGVTLVSIGGGGLSLAGVVMAPATQTVSLTTVGPTPGAITESGAGAISAGTLAFNGGAVTLAADNSFDTLGTSSAAGALNLYDGSSLQVNALTLSGAAQIASGADLTLNSALTAPGDLALSAYNTLNTAALNVGGNYSATAGAFDTTGLEFNPTLTGAASSLTATDTGGSIDLGKFSAISAPGALSISAQNGAVANSGTTALTGASVTVSGDTGVTVANVTAGGGSGAVTLTSDAGGVSQVASTAITGGLLTVTGDAGQVYLPQQNVVSGLSVASNSYVYVYDKQSAGLAVSSASAGTSSANIYNTGPVTVANGAIGRADGGLQIGSSNSTVEFLGSLALPGPTSIFASNGGAITFDGAVTGAYGLTTSTAGSTVFASTVGISATPLSSLTVDSAAKVEGDVFTSGETHFEDVLTIAPTAASHTLTLTSTGGDVVLDVGAEDSVAGQDTLAIVAPNGQFTTLGSLGASQFTGVAFGGLAITAQSASFASGGFAGNLPNNVGRLAVDLQGPLNFNAGTYALTVDTVAGVDGINTHGANVTLSAGALTLNADVNAGGIYGGVATLTSSGAIAQTGGGIIASTLSAQAGAGASVTLGSASNAVTTLASLTGTGATFRDAETGAGLSVTGADAGTGALSIENSGDLTIAAGLDAGTSVSLTSDSGSVRFPAAFSLPADTTVTAAAGSVTFAGAVDGAHALSIVAATAPGATGDTTFDGAVGGTVALTTLDVTGPATATAAITTSGAQTFRNALTLAPSSGSLITLTSTGGNVTVAAVDGATTDADSLAISAPQGAFTANGVLGGASELAGLAITAGSASLSTGNWVDTLAASLGASASPFAFDDGANALTIGVVDGVLGVTVAGTSGASLSAASLALNAPVNVGSAALQLTGGTITQTAPISAGTLQGSSVGGAALDGSNAVTSLGSFSNTGSGALSVTNAQSLSVAGPVGNTGGAVELTVSGPGSVLTVAAGTSPVVSASGAVSLASSGDIEVDGQVASTNGGAVVLYADSAASGSGTVSFGSGGSVSTSGPMAIYYRPASYADASMSSTQAYANKAYSDANPYTADVGGGGKLTAYMLVDTAADLQAVNTQLAGVYALNADVDLSTASGFAPLGSNAGPAFTGLFEGQGHTVANLTLNQPSVIGMGLFGVVGAGGIVRDLSVADASVSGLYSVGALAGKSYGQLVDDTVSGETVAGTDAVGGLVGKNFGAVSGSTVSGGTVGGADYVGGLVGYQTTPNGVAAGTYAQSVTDSSSSAAVSGSALYVGGLVGWNGQGSTITGSSASGAVVETGQGTAVGGLVGWNDAAAVITGDQASGQVVSQGDAVGGLVGKNYGVVEGASSYAGAGEAAGDVNGHDAVGGLIGKNFGTVEDASVAAGTTVVGVDYVGGLVGYQTTPTGVAVGTYAQTIGTSASAAAVTGSGLYVGGLAGWNGQGSTITNSTASGAVTETGSGQTATSVGGLVGWNDADASISAVTASGSVTSQSNAVGGIAGKNYGEIDQATYAGPSVTGADSVGGLVGRNFATVTGGAVTGAPTVTGADYVGGLVGYNGAPYGGGAYAAEISASYSTAAVSAVAGSQKGNDLGGLVGWNGAGATVQTSYAVGPVYGTTSSSTAVGGLVGYNQGSIANAFAALGRVTGYVDVGGLIGDNAGTVSDAYSTGAAGEGSLGGGALGGSIGLNETGGVLTDVYFDSDTAGTTTGAGQDLGAGAPVALTDAQSQQASSYAGFDFGAIWQSAPGYPVLRNLHDPYAGGS